MIHPLNRFLKERSVASTLMCLILPILLGVMLIFGEISVQIYRNVISGYIRNDLQSLTDSSVTYLDNFLSEAMRQSYYIYSSQQFQAALEEADALGDSISIQQTMQMYNEVFDPLFTALNNPVWYVNRVYLLEESLHADRSFIRYCDQLPEEIPVSEITAAPNIPKWYLATEKTAFSSKQNSDSGRLLCYVRVITTSSGKPVALLNTEIYLDALEPVIAQAVPKDAGGVYLWQTADGQTIFQSGEFSQEGYWTAQGTLQCNSSTLVTGYSTDWIEQQSRQQHTALFVLSLCMVIAAFLMISAVSRLALKRLHMVTEKFAAFDEEGHLASLAVLEGKDEAASLDRVLTELYQKYQDNANACLQLEKACQIMEYQMLMSKINPHFLYNTLSVIRWSILEDDKEEAVDAVDHLVAFYRGVLSRGRDVVPLQMEVETLREYVRLQSYTYSRTLCFDCRIPPGAGQYFILKFLLQPIVENAILYSRPAEECRIELKALVKGEKLFLYVWNNGPAIQEEIRSRLNHFNCLNVSQLSALTVSRTDRESYGVYNVISRIRLLYGREYGLWYSVPERGGTLAEFHLPLLTGSGTEEPRDRKGIL